MKKLVYFTAVYPFVVSSETWKTNELSVFREYFDDIVVAPLKRQSSVPTHTLPDGVRYLNPILDATSLFFSKLQLLRLLNQRSFRHLSALRGIQLHRLFQDAKNWCLAALMAEHIIRSKVFQSYILPELHDSYLYFFWAAGYASILPLLPHAYQRRAVVRFHSHDLYWERNNGFIPYQKSIAESAAVLAPISSHGTAYLKYKYPSCVDKISCQRLGTTAGGLSQPSQDGTFRIVSCAYLSPVKRLHLIPECLLHIQRKIEWTHIGDGWGLSEVMDMAKKLPQNVTARFVGRLDSEEVSRFYSGHCFDLFVNVSEIEGIPVSAMEAMAAGIPVLATDVGGTSELVDETVGRLLPKDFTPDDFLKAVEHFASLSTPARDEMRRKCNSRILEEFDSASNARRMAELILSVESDL